MVSANNAMPLPRPMTNRNPSCDGTATGPSVIVRCDRTTPATALEIDVPMARISVLRLFAAAVSDTGTAPMINAGIAP